jgi:fumarylpyruvate hydrolase
MSTDNARHVFPPPAITTLPVADGADLFPVRRVYCVARNYAAHAVEMGHDPQREPPFFFQKNPDDLRTDGVFVHPGDDAEVHHEIELVVALAQGGRNIPAERALERVFGYGVGLDMTRRDLQAEAKRLGRPWTAAKAFDGSAPCSALVPAAAVAPPTSGAVWLDIDGERRQHGDLEQMIWKVPDVIAHLSRLFTLAAGDVIFTGTPAGVGPVKPGDRLHGHVDGIGDLRVEVR